MQATRLWRLACLLVLGSAATASCGKDEAASPSITPGGGEAGGGERSSAGATSTAGEDSGPLGGNASSTAGSTSTMGGALPAGGTATGSAGATTAGAAGVGGELSSAGNGGSGSSTPPGEQLVLCTRLTNRVNHAVAQGKAFATAAYADCRVRWIVPLKPDLDEYRQQLVIWDLEFWGCQGNPVTNFGLVWGTPALSAGDASILIELYLTAANAELELSTDERTEMKAALDRLAEPLISSPSEDPSQSSCVDDTGSPSGTPGAGGDP